LINFQIILVSNSFMYFTVNCFFNMMGSWPIETLSRWSLQCVIWYS
jgi:hypothetical protein